MYPNSDPGMFWVAFYGCLLAEVIPVPIEVPLSRKVNKCSISMCQRIDMPAYVQIFSFFSRMQVSASWVSYSVVAVLV